MLAKEAYLISSRTELQAQMAIIYNIIRKEAFSRKTFVDTYIRNDQRRGVTTKLIKQGFSVSHRWQPYQKIISRISWKPLK